MTAIRHNNGPVPASPDKTPTSRSSMSRGTDARHAALRGRLDEKILQADGHVGAYQSRRGVTRLRAAG